MKVIDKREKNEKWQLGDVLVDDYSHVGLIVKAWAIKEEPSWRIG